MKRTTSLFVAITILSSIVLSSCYKEGAKISFRTKKNRLVNEWSLTEYEVDGSPNDQMKNAWSNDSFELLFVITGGDAYGFNIQYKSGSGKIFTANRPEQSSTYAAIQNGFRDNVVFNQKLAKGGHWTFTDNYKKIRFGVIGNPDVAYDEGTDYLEAEIIKLKNEELKLSFDHNGQKHTMNFEAWKQ